MKLAINAQQLASTHALSQIVDVLDSYGGQHKLCMSFHVVFIGDCRIFDA